MKIFSPFYGQTNTIHLGQEERETIESQATNVAKNLEARLDEGRDMTPKERSDFFRALDNIEQSGRLNQQNKSPK